MRLHIRAGVHVMFPSAKPNIARSNVQGTSFVSNIFKTHGVVKWVTPETSESFAAAACSAQRICQGAMTE